MPLEMLQAEIVRRGAGLGLDTPVPSISAAVLSARPGQS